MEEGRGSVSEGGGMRERERHNETSQKMHGVHRRRRDGRDTKQRIGDGGSTH